MCFLREVQMKRLTYVNENERQWQPFSPSTLEYSIDWNDRTGIVRLTLPNGAQFFSDKDISPAAAEVVGEGMLENTAFCHLLKRREFNGRIEVIKLG